jgi:hypothetical protein
VTVVLIESDSIRVFVIIDGFLKFTWASSGSKVFWRRLSLAKL